MKRLFRALEDQLSAGKKRLDEARERLEQRIVDEAKDRLVEHAKGRLAAEASGAKERLTRALFGDDEGGAPDAGDGEAKASSNDDDARGPAERESAERESAERGAAEREARREAARREAQRREAEQQERAREAARAAARQKAEIDDELAALKRKLGK